MKTIFTALLLALSASAFAQEAPGSAWTVLTLNPSPIRGTPEDNNVLLQGRAEQGLIVARFGDTRVNTFAAVNYSVDKNGLGYNNKIVPMLGVKLQRDLGERGILEAGVQLVHQHNFRADNGQRSGTGVQAFVSVWSGWDLRK